MMLLTVLSPFLMALVAPWLHRWQPHRSGPVLCLWPLLLTVYLATWIGALPHGQAVVQHYPWVPSLGISFSIYIDGLSLIFALMISGVGALIFLYAASYLKGDEQLGRFYVYLAVFMGSMLGVVLAGNLITLFVFWELTSLSSYFLIGYENQRETARAAALQALLVTGVGGLCLLAGMLLMGQVAGSLELNTVLSKGADFRASGLYLPILILVLLGALTKSAQTPFHFWLPGAMEAPTPVSAYLHSVTMVKAGVYLLMRFSPALGGTIHWQMSLTTVGAVTMLTGACLAVVQTDIKKLLAYTTVNGLGTLVLLTGIGTPLAVKAAVAYLLTHALYKGAWFLTAGIVSHETGTRDVTHISGLARRLPLVAAAAVLASLSMAGLPPLLGFISKELVYEALLRSPPWPALLVAAAVLANVGIFAATGRLLLKPFFGADQPLQGSGHALGIGFWLGPVLLAAAGLVSGLMPSAVAQTLLEPAAVAIQPAADSLKLALWHGWTIMLGLSLLTVAGGVLVYKRSAVVLKVADDLRWFVRWGPERGYEAALHLLKGFAAWQTRWLQSGYLRHYVLIILVTTIALVGFTLVRPHRVPFDVRTTPLQTYDVVVALLMLIAAIITVRTHSRLVAIVTMGMIGYGLALIFVDFGAPDLAMTQFVIETMTVILFVLSIYRLPRKVLVVAPLPRLRNAIVAVTAGALMTILVLVALSVQTGSRLSPFFKENSLLLAHGRNIVNVIIVDFRAMDTLGEITVLSLAGIGVYTLLKLRYPGRN